MGGRGALPPLRVLAAAATTVVCLLLISGVLTGVFSAYRAQLPDALFPAGTVDERVVVVGVDHRSIEASGQRWPWPRDRQAALVSAIAAAKPALIVLDVVYSPATGEDAVLSAALASAGPVVLAALPTEVTRGDLIYEAAGLTAPVASVAAGLPHGHTAVTPDPADGVVRLVPLVLEGPDRAFIPSLALAAAASFDGSAQAATLRPNGVQIGGRFIPTESKGRLRVAYPEGLGAGATVVSAADVLAGQTPPTRLRDKIVFVGVTDPAVGDYHPTPVAKAGGAAGVMVQASVLNTMLTNNFLATASRAESIAWVVALALLVAAATSRLRLWAACLVAVGVVVVYFLVAFVRFDAGTIMDLVYPPLAALSSFVAILATRFGAEAAERRRVAGLLEQYVPTPVAKHLLARGRAAGLPPTGQLTFLFTDVVGSTEAWERYPREMADAMRRHDVIVEGEVEAAGGAVVRPRGEGDSRFCVFVNPVDAVRAALAVGAALDEERWATPEPVRVRMGIHTGEAELRAADYYGSSVNRCARIRGVAQAGEIVMSSVTAELVEDALGGAKLRDRGLHELKGMADAEHVFELVPAVTKR